MLNHRRTRRGAATVEFALVAPIFFFTIIIPMIEFGRAMTVASGIAATAQVGCRTGALYGKSNSDIQTAVDNNLAALGIKNANPIVVKVKGGTANASTAAQGDLVSVTVSVDYGNISWLPVSLCKYLGVTTLSSTQVMRRE